MTPGIVQYLAASAESLSWFEDSYDSGQNPDLWLYRGRTQAVLRRYFRMSLEAGRLPSILGQQFFRSHVTSYRASSFEDVVIFVHDVERSIAKLDWLSQQLIARIVFQGYSYYEMADLLGSCRKTVVRRMPDALDKMSEIFLSVGMLKPLTMRKTQDRSLSRGGNFGNDGNHVIREEIKKYREGVPLPCETWYSRLREWEKRKSLKARCESAPFVFLKCG